MRLIYRAVCISLCLQLPVVPLFAGETDPAKPILWDEPPAVTLPESAFQVGMFQPLRYGLSDKIELSSHPILDFVIPNLSVKISHGENAGRLFAARYTLVYPTPLLRLIQKKGIGGIIAEDPTIPDMPHMVSLRSELLMSITLAEPHYITWKAGVVVAAHSGTLDSRTTIDLPVVYPRLAPYYNRFGLNGGV
ncbi:MAG TPA: hypothetical protein VKA68_15965, partial [bacterium]|nr:hypothetical protein [bacterium]